MIPNPQPIRSLFRFILANISMPSGPKRLCERLLSARQREQIHQLMEDLREKIEICDDTYDKREQNFYYLLRSACHIWLGRVDQAFNAARLALDGFQVCDDRMAEMYTHWWLGELYALQGRGHHFESEIQKAIEDLKRIRDRYYKQGEYEKSHDCDELLGMLESERDVARRMGTGPLQPPGQIADFFERDPPAARLSLPWLPFYGRVTAGPGGVVVWDEPDERFLFTLRVELDGRPFRLFALKATSASDRQITLSPSERYGWVQVRGHSMRAASPVPICDGDYVLFKDSRSPAHQDIVIAGYRTPAGDYAYMVKRFSATQQMLLSETDDGGEDYSPVKLGPGYVILGIAIAVAKPDEFHAL